MIRWLHRDLQAWGLWMAQREDRRGGYAGRSSLANVAQVRTKQPPQDQQRLDGYHQKLLAAFRQLEPARLAHGVERYYMTGCVAAATARELGVSERTVRNWRDSAHDQLQRRLRAAGIDIDNRTTDTPAIG